MIGITFNLIGFDWYRIEGLFGFWIGNIKIETEIETKHKALFCIYWNDGLILELFFIKVLGRDL